MRLESKAIDRKANCKAQEVAMVVGVEELTNPSEM